MASQDIDHLALGYALRGARFKHTIDLGPKRG